MRKCFIFSMIILTTIYGTENEKLAQTGYQFLSVTSDARSGGMADAMTTIHGRSVSLFFNPAGIARQTELVDINFSSNNWIAGIKHNAFSLSFSPKSGQYGVFGLSLLNVDYGEMQGTMVWDNTQGFIDTEKFRPSAFAMGLGYGRALSDNFSLGGQLKKAYQYLGENVVPITDSSKVLSNNVSSAIAFDFGTIYVTGWNDFTFGMSIRNFSEEVQYAYDGFQLPLTFRIGASIDLLEFISKPSKAQALLLAIDALHPRSYSQRINAGLEYSFMNIVNARIGYLHNYDERAFTFGAGFKLGIFYVDYAYTPFGIFDEVSRISIGISK